MNTTEAVQMLGYLSRAGLVRVMEGQGEVWADAMPDVTLADAITVSKQLVRTHTGSDRWVTPGDIIEGTQVLRRRRIADMATPVPPESIDPDDTATERKWIRAYTQAIGDGHDEATADRVACATVNVTRPLLVESPRPVAPVIENIARTMPRVPRPERKAS